MKASKRYKAIAAYYDAEYASNDLLDNDTPFLLSHLSRRSVRVLELCCGTARAAIPIAQAGHRVVGVDIDSQLLQIARRKRDYVGLDDSKLRFVRQDVLKLKLGELFDWSFLNFNTLLNFTTLVEQDRLIANVHRHLKPAGRFWIDIFNPDLSILAETHHAHFDSAIFYVPELDRTVQRTTEISRAAKRSQLQQMTFHYTWADASGALIHEDISFEMTWMFPRELTLLLERHGFIVEALYGAYDGSAITPESPRLIAVARKARR